MVSINVGAKGTKVTLDVIMISYIKSVDYILQFCLLDHDYK